MTPSQAAKVREMVESKFLAIGITINSDRETYNPSIAKQIPKEKVLVTLEIPCEGVCMPDFFRKFCETLDQESIAATQKERVG
jgi:hypothetical protein